jgi:hypothetical protein
MLPADMLWTIFVVLLGLVVLVINFGVGIVAQKLVVENDIRMTNADKHFAFP